MKPPEWKSNWIIFSSIVFIILLVSLAFFLNFISSLYSDIDISTIDLSRVNRRHKKIKMIIYIIKNNYFLAVGCSILLIFLNIAISGIISKLLPSLWGRELIVAFALVIFTELFVRYLTDQEFTKHWIFNPLLFKSAYLITCLAALPLRRIIKEKTLSSYKEQDLIRLMNNMEAENVLEPQEVRLLRAAFNFDEETIGKYFKLRKQVIFLSIEMNLKKIKQIYHKHRFTRYPVLTEKREVAGILNFKTLDLEMKSKNDNWHKFVEKRINFIPENTKLNVALEIFQRSRQHLAIVTDNKDKFIGIITLEDVLENLVGKIQDENEKKQ